MRTIFCLLILPAVLVSTAPAAPGDFPGLGPPGTLVGLKFEPDAELLLRGPNARAQLVTVGNFSSGQLHDLTHQVSYQAAPSGIVRVDRDGFVTPLTDGEVQITAKGPAGKSAVARCRVVDID